MSASSVDFHTPPEAAPTQTVSGSWATASTAATRPLMVAGGALTVVLADDLDLGIPTPSFPEDARSAVAAVPFRGLTILNGIPPIGTKFHPADELGPQGEPHRVDGVYRGTVWLR